MGEMGEMRIMGTEGDSKHIWDPEDEDQTAGARALYDTLVGEKNYKAFKTDKTGKKGANIKKFDPKAGRIIMVPPIAGG